LHRVVEGGQKIKNKREVVTNLEEAGKRKGLVREK